jgi:hypothetical protein
MARTKRITAAQAKAAARLEMTAKWDAATHEYVLLVGEDEEAARDAAWDVAFDRAQQFVRAEGEAEIAAAEEGDDAALEQVAHDPEGTKEEVDSGEPATAEDFGFSDAAHAQVPDHQSEPPSSQRRGTIVARDYKDRYGKEQNCGDVVAQHMAELIRVPKARGSGYTVNDQALYALGAQNDVDVVELWGARNVGQQAMNLSNVLRGRLRGGHTVRFGGVELNLARVEAENPELPAWEVAKLAGVLTGSDGDTRWVDAVIRLRARRTLDEQRAAAKGKPAGTAHDAG